MIFKFLFSVVRLSRPVNIIMTGLTVYLMAFLSNFPMSDILVLVTAFVAILTAASGNIINDIYDLEIDSVNRPDRILPSKQLSIHSAIFVYILFVGISIGIAVLSLKSSSVFIVLFTHFLLWIYSAYLKKTPLLGNITVAFILGLTFIFSGIVFNSVQTAIVPFSLAFFFSLTRELIKDIEDIDGDKIQNAKTLAILLGSEKTKQFAIVVLVISLLGLFVPYFVGIYGFIYVIFISLTVFVPGLFVMINLKNAASKEDYRKVANHLKILILPSLIALILDFVFR